VGAFILATDAVLRSWVIMACSLVTVMRCNEMSQ
jgi:hypothetical protein